jgi:hypothetical protein
VEAETIDPQAGFAADFWDHDPQGDQFRDQDWDRTYAQICDAKAGVNGGTLRLTRGAQTAPDCYYDAGLEVLECCDVLVVVWDGKAARGLGGTAEMVAHARALGLPLLIVDATTGKQQPERLEQFAAAGEAGCAVIQEIDAFSAKCASPSASGHESAESVFLRLAACSDQESEAFRGPLIRIIKLHGFATLVAAVACILPHSSVPWKVVLAALAFLELLMIGWALFLTRRLNRNEVHRRWIRARFATEIIRAMQPAALLDPLYPLVARHDASWRRYAVTLACAIRT